jgi:hypothetical protein
MHDVKTFAIGVLIHVLGRGLIVIVNGGGAEAFDRVTTFCACGSVNLRTSSFCDLYRYVPDATCATLHQNFLASVDVGAVYQTFPGSDEYQMYSASEPCCPPMPPAIPQTSSGWVARYVGFTSWTRLMNARGHMSIG